MRTVPAVCPSCAQVLQVDADDLPDVYTCPNCSAQLTHQWNGAAITFSQVRQQPEERSDVQALLTQAEDVFDPKKKYALLQQALALDPASYQANLALLLLGRLYERDKKPGDFRVIKCYLMNVFEQPEAHSAQEREEMLRELVEDPQLLRTLELAPDAQRFWDTYFGDLADNYLTIFIRARSGVSKLAFGLPRSSKEVARLSGGIVAKMMSNLSEERQLEPLYRQQLRQALRQSYTRMFPGYEAFLNDSDA